MAVDRGATDHDIVDDGETALAADPVPLTILDATVGQNGSLVESYSAAVELLCDGNLIRMEKVPARSIDDFIWSVAQNVND